MCWALDLVLGGQREQRQCRVDSRLYGSSLVCLHLAGSRSMFVVILISILIHVSPRFIQMNLIKSLSLIFILCKKFTERR